MEKLLTSHTTRDCAVDGDIVVIDADTDARSALRTLCDNGISSAPVYDSAAKQYVGILDVRDLACFIALEFDELHASVTSNKFIESE
jgi:CBS domain containing-hemolysin-like protein